MVQDYVCPGSVQEALECLKAHAGQALVIAGGTDVLPDIRTGKVAPECLVDITDLPGLNRIEVGENFVTIGATVTFARIREHPFLKERVPALVEAAGSVGSPAIQNVATWAGNIVQAMPAADGAIVAIALDAQARVAGADGTRWNPVRSLFEGPGVSRVDPTRQIVTAIRFPNPGPGTGTAWRRLGRRAALVLPILNCAVRVCLEPGSSRCPGPRDATRRIAEAAIALGPVGPRPRRMLKAESSLRGRVPAAEVVAEAAHLATSEATPRSSLMRASREYRLQIIPVLVTEALNTALERARWADD